MQRIELFNAETLNDLQTVINAFCERALVEPLAVSITPDDQNGEYIAAVVVREV